MSSVKISQLPLASSLSPSDVFPIVQDGVTKGISWNDALTLPLIEGTYGPKVSFKKNNYGSEVDIIIPGVLEITRGNNQGIYNAALELSYNGNVSPENTEWNNKILDQSLHGWALACNAFNLPYVKWSDSIDADSWINPLAQSDQGYQIIMRETTTDRYWLIRFKQWTNGGAGGGFEYDRWEIFTSVDFVRPSLQPGVVDVITPGKTIIKRDNQYGLYNAALENSYLLNNGDGVPRTPSGTLWNSEYTDNRSGYSGWSNLTNIRNRVFSNWHDAVDGAPADSVDNELELVMLDQATGFYYTIKFTNWGQGGNNGAFSYTRRLIPMTQSIGSAGGPGAGEGGVIDYGAIHDLNYRANSIKFIFNGYSNYTLSVSDQGKMLISENSMTITVPQMRVQVGTQIDIINGGTSVDFIAGPGVTINSNQGSTSLADQYTAASLIYIQPDTWVLIGKLS